MWSIIAVVLFILLVSLCCCGNNRSSRNHNQDTYSQSNFQSGSNYNGAVSDRDFDEENTILDIIALAEMSKMMSDDHNPDDEMIDFDYEEGIFDFDDF